MSSFDIYLDNVSCVREKLYPVRRPDIVTPKRNYKEYDIPGRDGKYFEDLGTYDDITFNVNFNFKEKKEYLNKTFRDYKRMIRKSKTLMMMDDSEIFYKIKKVEFGDISRENTKEINAFVIHTDIYLLVKIDIVVEWYRQILMRFLIPFMSLVVKVNVFCL